ncbi:MAG: site-specific DNA-methyltransferase [Candidatus Marinimicrobia bacterium]|nr:site-specific DNA-methyltransferase [Candidatus Neomarinimicrobiota bacterium]MDD5230354.1 site-specific DNA-methyltransferase [Candidatus Neomarinimicrobiota bacterium]MDD5539791.1 site-specific DNA-methyltransferase [Candidatus Neomarinimicrobiota bacterium]
MIDKIVNADCFSLLPTLEPASIDLIFSDPPYEQSLRDIHPDWNDGLDWNRLAAEFDRVLKPSGQLALFCDWSTGQMMTTALRDRFKFRFIWVWRKSVAQPINKKMPLAEVELIAVYSKRKSRLKDLTFNWKDISGRGEPYRRAFSRKNNTRKPIKPYFSQSAGQRYPKQILNNFPSKCNMPESERTDHPTQKPLGLCGYVIKALSNEGDLVCDPFSGSGTTAIASHRLGRNFIAIERDPVYYVESVKRLERERAQGNLFAKNETSGVRLNDTDQTKANVPLLTENRL